MVGGYADRHDDQWGVIFTEHDGTWHRGAKAPVPANAGLNAAPANSFENPLASVSCATASNASRKPHTFLNSISCASAKRCTVVGDYADRSGKTHGLLLSLRLR